MILWIRLRFSQPIFLADTPQPPLVPVVTFFLRSSDQFDFYDYSSSRTALEAVSSATSLSGFGTSKALSSFKSSIYFSKLWYLVPTLVSMITPIPNSYRTPKDHIRCSFPHITRGKRCFLIVRLGYESFLSHSAPVTPPATPPIQPS